MTYQPLTREQYQKAIGAGFTPDQILQNESRRKHLEAPAFPVLTKEDGGFGTALKDQVVGGIKSVVEGARGTSQMIQGLGQRAVALATPASLDEVRANTGFKSLDDSTKEGASVTNILEAKSRAEQVGKALGTVAELASGFTAVKGPQAIVKAKQALTASKEAKAGEKVLEMITPKPTVPQAKLAQSEGRLVKGKEPTLFRSGTADTILPTQKTLSAKETIIKKIPNASKLNETQLFDAVDTEVTKTAEALRPQMKATPIKSETIQKINDDWTALKKSQIELADATEEANVIKLQKQFEQRLQKTGSNNHDDLWQARIEYDNSIPENVKKANVMSDAKLQDKKEIWLQNRAILNDAINDSASGMGESSSKAFKEMSDLYEAKNSILSKAKIEKAEISKLNKFWKDHPGVVSALKLGGGYTILKNFGVPLP